jgi:putative DNA primase/helicase
VFVLPRQVLGESEEEIVYQPDVPMIVAETLHGRGKLADWQASIAVPCKGNPVLMFALMCGLAGPLLKLVQEQSGGFHFYGVTTAGKTTAAQVAASCWGCAADPQEGPEVTSIRKWYTTGNALEGLAEVHNDTLLALDEISEVDPQELGRIIYQLAGGLSKGRAQAGGGLRAMRAWRLLFISTGEKSVRQVLGSVGQVAKGGQRVRLPDIPVDRAQDGARGIVLDAHGAEPKDFIQDLKAACSRVYGLAGPLFASYLIAEAKGGWVALSGDLRGELKTIEALLTQDCVERLPPEGQRILRRFATVALAGSRAVWAKIIPWELSDVLAATRYVRDRWLDDCGTELSEVDRALGHVRDELIRHRDRFVWAAGEKASKPVRDVLGFRVPDYFLLHERGMREVAGEFDVRAILRELRARGLLWSEEGKLTRRAPRLPDYGPVRPHLYWISVRFLGTVDDNVTAEDEAAGAQGPTPSDGVPF